MKNKKLRNEVKASLNLTELTKIESVEVKGGQVAAGCDGCPADISYFAENIGDGCSCGSIFNAIGLNL